jgi:hypothetical protein
MCVPVVKNKNVRACCQGPRPYLFNTIIFPVRVCACNYVVRMQEISLYKRSDRSETTDIHDP